MLKIIQSIAIFTLTACVGTSEAPTSTSEAPINYSALAQTYGAVCGPTATIVYPPLCISDIHYMNEDFEYDWQFQSCRISVENFVTALDKFASCKISDVTIQFDKVIEDTEDLLDCYETQLNALKKDPTKLSVKCSPLSVPTTVYMDVDFYYTPADIASVILDFGVPNCATYHSNNLSWYFFSLEECKEKLEDYLTTSLLSPEARRDMYINDLSSAISSYKERAIRVFNCKAERRNYCQNEWYY